SPGSWKAYDHLAAQVDSLLDHLEPDGGVDVAVPPYDPEHPVDPVALSVEGRDLRATFGLVHSSWSSTALGRLWVDPNRLPTGAFQPQIYVQHLRRLARLVNLLRVLTARAAASIPPYEIDDRPGAHRPSGWLDEYHLWDLFNERQAIDEPPPIDLHPILLSVQEGGALYVDELAWLYNELGLLQLSRGALFDAYALYRMVEDLNAIAERGTSGYRRQELELSFAAIAIERGQLRDAMAHVDRVRAAAECAGPSRSDLWCRATMYRGEILFLQGSYDQAEAQLTKACRWVAGARVPNHRAASMVHRRRGDLRLNLRQWEKAARDFTKSVAFAETGRHYDLLFATRVRQAYLDVVVSEDVAGQAAGISLFDETAVRGALDESLRFANTCGIPRLEHDTRQVRAELSLRLGDFDDAADEAHRCLALTSINGMSLRTTSSLALLARIRARQHPDWGGERLLNAARARASRQLYQQEIEVVEREMIRVHHGQEI
ncbi:MAG TPA: hypothetical protein VK507_13650, partial [Iamia sp.]|nr:hypothetical protein [Iamia sp.]